MKKSQAKQYVEAGSFLLQCQWQPIILSAHGCQQFFVSDSQYCVLAHIYGSYNQGRKRLLLNTDIAIKCGFDIPRDLSRRQRKNAWNKLQRAWINKAREYKAFSSTIVIPSEPISQVTQEELVSVG